MRLPPFRYHAPRSFAEAAAILRDEGPAAMVLAGGTDLLPNMKRRQQTPSVVVGLKKILDAHLLIAAEEGLSLGSCLTLTQLAGEKHVILPQHLALQRAASKVASPHLRNVATLGGNLCLDTRCNYYDQSHEWRKSIGFCKKAPGPTGQATTVRGDTTCWVAPGSERCWAVSSTDTAPALVALGASVTLVSKDGSRQLPLSGLYADDGMSFLTRRPDEILATVNVPALEGWRSTYWKLRRRGSFDFPVLSVAAAVKLTPRGEVEDARVVLGAVASRPLEVPEAATLVGRPLSDDVLEAFADRAAKHATPLDNTDFALSWRKKVARPFVIGALKELRGEPIERLGLLAREAARLVPMNV